MIYLASFRAIGSHGRAKLFLTRLVILLAGLDGSIFHGGSNEKLRCSSSVASFVGACCIQGHMAFVAFPSSFPPSSRYSSVGMSLPVASPLLSLSSFIAQLCVFPLYLALYAGSARAVRHLRQMHGSPFSSFLIKGSLQEATGSSHRQKTISSETRHIRRSSIITERISARCRIPREFVWWNLSFSHAHARTKL